MNIGEIAKLAGVSRATISRYLNNGYVSEEKRERIKAIIEETGYVPSSQAQMLRTKKTKLIGVILPKVSSETIGKVVDGISEQLAEAGYHLILANTDNNTDRELEYLNIFKNNQVDGVIFIATIISEKHKQMLKEMLVPIVIVGQQLEGYCCVYHDDYNTSKEITKLMIDSGCQALGYVGVTIKDKAAGLDRKNGFMDAVEDAKKEAKDIQVVAVEEGFFSMESGYNLMKNILQQSTKVDGIFCATDSIAMGAIQAIKEEGRRIPEDISVVGIGNTRMSRVVEPALTTASYYYKISGTEAATMLLTLINGETSYTKKIKLGYEIIQRKSTK